MIINPHELGEVNGQAVSVQPKREKISGERSLRSMPSIVSFFFGIAMSLFMAQSWSVDIIGIPIQAILILLLFLWVVLFRTEVLRNSLTIFSKVQWLAIGSIAISILIRTAIDGWNLQRLGQLAIGIMIALLASQIFAELRGKNTVIRMILMMAVLSCSIAILQYLGISSSLWQKTKYAYSGDFTYGAAGLEASPVPFTYSVIGIASILIGAMLLHLLYQVRILPISTPFLYLFGGIILLGLLVSNSRSGLLGIFLAIFFVIYLSYTDQK